MYIILIHPAAEYVDTRVEDPGGLVPDPTPTHEKKPDPGPEPTLEKTTWFGSNRQVNIPGRPYKMHP